ncbi:MAG: hypothetical protein QXF61_11000 [Nitrososphaeria archaeon]
MVSGEVEEFLRFLPLRTARTYCVGLELFERFYGGSTLVFLSECQANRGRPMLERKGVEREVLSGFAEWLVRRGVVPKIIPHLRYCCSVVR